MGCELLGIRTLVDSGEVGAAGTGDELQPVGDTVGAPSYYGMTYGNSGNLLVDWLAVIFGDWELDCAVLGSEGILENMGIDISP